MQKKLGTIKNDWQKYFIISRIKIGYTFYVLVTSQILVEHTLIYNCKQLITEFT